MACGCKNKIKNRKNLITKGKKAAPKKPMPLITIRKTSSKKSSK